MTLAVDKIEGRGHINTACHERLPKKTKVLATKDYRNDGALYL